MFNLQGSEIIVILLLALVVLGPEKLPDAIRRFTQVYGELKKMGTGFQSELKAALDEPMREMRETADMVMNAANPDKLAAQVEAERTSEAKLELDAKQELAAKREPETEHGSDASPATETTQGGPVNLIAAANSSAALTAAVESVAGESADAEVSRPSGPAFHSAAPRPTAAADPDIEPDAGGGTDDATSADDAASAEDDVADVDDVQGEAPDDVITVEEEANAP